MKLVKVFLATQATLLVTPPVFSTLSYAFPQNEIPTPWTKRHAIWIKQIRQISLLRFSNLMNFEPLDFLKNVKNSLWPRF